MIQRLVQYIQRFVAVYLHVCPSNYTKRKLEILTEFYHLTNHYLKSVDAQYWLSYGTLLGYHRENSIMVHDIDIDYSADDTAFHAIWHHRNQLPKGVKLFDTSSNHRGPKLFFSYKGFDADIYFYEKKEKTLCPYLISSIPADMLSFPQSWIYPLKKIEFLGETTFVPSNPKSYLEHCYGYIGRNAVFDKKTGYWYQRS